MVCTSAARLKLREHARRSSDEPSKQDRERMAMREGRKWGDHAGMRMADAGVHDGSKQEKAFWADKATDTECHKMIAQDMLVHG
eukprot:1496126-Rhodomonas_salina.1